MLRSLYLVPVVLAATAAAAAAETPADRGQVIFSAERLSPLLSYSKVRVDQGNGDSTTTTTTSSSVFWSGSPNDFYDVPRLGLDYAIAQRVTLGGDLFFTTPFSTTRSSTNGNTTTSRDGTKVSALGFGIRGGYVARVTYGVSLWLRGGLSYARVGTDSPITGNGDQTTTTVSQWGLDLEGYLVISPGTHFGLFVGPVLDAPLTGNQHAEIKTNNATVSQDTDASQFHFGLTAGLMGWL